METIDTAWFTATKCLNFVNFQKTFFAVCATIVTSDFPPSKISLFANDLRQMKTEKRCIDNTFLHHDLFLRGFISDHLTFVMVSSQETLSENRI